MAGTQGYMVQPDPNADPFPMSGTAAMGPVDKAAFAESASRYVPMGGEWKDAGTDLTDGQGGVIRLTAKRAAHVNLRTSAGVEAGTTTQPVQAARVAGRVASYSAVFSLTLAANPTDIVQIQGSATKTVRIQRIVINGFQTVSGTGSVALVRRSSAAAGGTSSAPVLGQWDTTDPAPTAVIAAYTANPTPGTTVANMKGEIVTFTTGTTPGQVILWAWGEPGQEQPTLRGVAEFFCLNMGGAAIAGGLLRITLELSEE